MQCSRRSFATAAQLTRFYSVEWCTTGTYGCHSWKANDVNCPRKECHLIDDALETTVQGLFTVSTNTSASTEPTQPPNSCIFNKQTKHAICCLYASTLSAPSSRCSYGYNVFLVSTAPCDGSIQNFVQQSPQVLLLYACYYLHDCLDTQWDAAR